MSEKDLDRAIWRARKKLPIPPKRMLAWDFRDSGVTATEAYRLGAKEAQEEIVRRLVAFRSEIEDGAKRASPGKVARGSRLPGSGKGK
jgi:hypothetical protein